MINTLNANKIAEHRGIELLEKKIKERIDYLNDIHREINSKENEIRDLTS